MDMVGVVATKYVGEHRIFLRCNDGVGEVADLAEKEWLGTSRLLSNKQFFRYFSVESEALVWLNNTDIAPEYLYKKVTGHYPDYVEEES